MPNSYTIVIQPPAFYTLDYVGGGSQGPAGPPGAQGIQGIQGPVGVSGNLTGPITSVGNATSVAAQTGTGSTFVMQASPTLTTPNIGAATGTTLVTSGAITANNFIPSGTLSYFNANLGVAGTAGLSNTSQLAWSSTSNPSGASDITLSRLASGIVQVGTTGANSNGSIACTNATLSGTITASGTGTHTFGTGATKVTMTGGNIVSSGYNNSAYYYTLAGGYYSFITGTNVYSPSDGIVQIRNSTNALCELQVGKVTSGAGTLAAPSITLGDAGTGFYRVATNQIGFSVNGVDTLRIATGNLFYCFVDYNLYGRLFFGGTTSASPMFTKTGTTIKARLADDSADAPLTCGSFTATDFCALPVTFAGLPPASSKTGKSIQVSDRDYAIATSNGTNWLRAGTSTVLT